MITGNCASKRQTEIVECVATVGKYAAQLHYVRYAAYVYPLRRNDEYYFATVRYAESPQPSAVCAHAHRNREAARRCARRLLRQVLSR